MASLTSIRNAIRTNLANITSLTVFGYVPDSIEPPTAIVGVVESVNYDLTESEGADRYEIPVFLYVSELTHRIVKKHLTGFWLASGSSSVKTQIESDITLGGVAQSVRVVEADNYGVYTINNIDYLGVEFTVEVIA